MFIICSPSLLNLNRINLQLQVIVHRNTTRCFLFTLPISKALIKEPKLLHSSLNQERVLSCLNLNPAFVLAFSHSRETHHYSVYCNQLPFYFAVFLCFFYLSIKTRKRCVRQNLTLVVFPFSAK